MFAASLNLTCFGGCSFLVSGGKRSNDCSASFTRFGCTMYGFFLLMFSFRFPLGAFPMTLNGPDQISPRNLNFLPTLVAGVCSLTSSPMLIDFILWLLSIFCFLLLLTFWMRSKALFHLLVKSIVFGSESERILSKSLGRFGCLP